LPRDALLSATAAADRTGFPLGLARKAGFKSCDHPHAGRGAASADVALQEMNF
jgi:hypothetical protein